MSDETYNEYEDAKRTIRLKKTGIRRSKISGLTDEFDEGLYDARNRKMDVTDYTQIGTKVLIGGGVGLLAGVGTIVVAASAAEIVVAGVVTKITGVIGGALGLSIGINQARKRNM